MALPSTWDVGYKCNICFSQYDISVTTQSEEYRQSVVESCVDNFFSEITGDEFDWNLCNEVMPFCQDCWEAMEKIHELIQHKENGESPIDELVKNWSSNVLSNRKYLKKKGHGLSSVSSNQNVNPFGDGIKIEGYSVTQNTNIKCKMCHSSFVFSDPGDFMSLDISTKVMNNCEKHLYPELMEDGFYDWNSIPFNNYVPFCVSCSQEMNKIIEWDDKLTGIADLISDSIDLFTLKVLKCRRVLKKKGRRGPPRNTGFRDDRSCASMDSQDSQDSQDTLDWNEDCQIINIPSSGDYRGILEEPSLQDTLLPFREHYNNSNTPPPIPSTSSQYRDDPQVENAIPLTAEPLPQFTENKSFDSNVVRPNSVETFVVSPQYSNYGTKSSSAMDRVKPEKFNRPLIAAVLKTTYGFTTPVRNQTSAPNFSRPQVAIARLSTTKNSGTLFKCGDCGKIFIFRKCWEAHAGECPMGSPKAAPPATIGFDTKTCCGNTFTSQESWNGHVLQHQRKTSSSRNNSQAPPRTKSLPNGQNPKAADDRHNQTVAAGRSHRTRTPEARKRPTAAANSVQFFCDFCTKICQSKGGLKLHIQSHNNSDKYKCKRCPESFAYSTSLTAHVRKTHLHEIQSKLPSPTRVMPKLAPQLKAQVPTKVHNVKRGKASQKKRITNFHCRFCPTPVRGKNELMEHIQSHYSVAQGRRCEICKVVFNLPDSLRKHNQCVHKNLY